MDEQENARFDAAVLAVAAPLTESDGLIPMQLVGHCAWGVLEG